MPAVAKEATNRRDLVIRLQGVTSTVRDVERHLVGTEPDLEVVMLGFLCRCTERLKHLDDVTPVNVVRCRVGEELLECALVIRHGKCPSKVESRFRHESVVHPSCIGRASVVHVIPS